MQQEKKKGSMFLCAKCSLCVQFDGYCCEYHGPEHRFLTTYWKCVNCGAKGRFERVIDAADISNVKSIAMSYFTCSS